MTEHRKIDVPGQKSLLERATDHFGLHGLGTGAAPAVAPPAAEKPASFSATAARSSPAAARPALSPSPARQIHSIDRDHLREGGFIVPGGPVTGLLEEFRIVKRQLVLNAAESRAGAGPIHGERILVASALPGEGKTYCAINLAISIAAEKDTEVLLVDADFAKPSVLSALGLPDGPGLMDALADPSLDVEECVSGTDIPGLSVLPAGRMTSCDTELLASARTAQVLDRLTDHSPNRIIIFDSPPVLAASPASELALHVGQTVVVVRADRTGEAALKDALSLLGGCETIQLLLNWVQFSPTGRRFGGYYGYGE
ncbi:AAA family ATPase [Novosphingobium tardum]|uniref:AAA family ATPase n=1 Tax=Novosphingobium tardum TaxID=1538021 RepID=A0ABV8RTJ6_9SPHN